LLLSLKQFLKTPGKHWQAVLLLKFSDPHRWPWSHLHSYLSLALQNFLLTVFLVDSVGFRKQLLCLHGLLLLCARGLVSGSTLDWMSKHLLLRSCVLLSIFISRRSLLMEGKSEYWFDAIILIYFSQFQCSVRAFCFSRAVYLDNVGWSNNAAATATSCLNWTSNHSMHLSLAQLFQSILVMVLSSSIATFRLSCSMTRKACIPCLHFSKCTVTRGRYAWYNIWFPAFRITPRITNTNENSSLWSHFAFIEL